MSVRPKTALSQYGMILGLLIIFATPGLAAYLFYQHPNWLHATRVNKGRLLEPALALPALGETKTWRIVFWSPGPCDKHCVDALDTLTRVRLALGRKFSQVEHYLLLSNKNPAITPPLQALLNHDTIRELSLAQEQTAALPNEAQVFLADPRGFLILSYSAKVKPNEIYQDLKRLIDISEKQHA